MTAAPVTERPIPPVIDTLRWVVVGFRLLSWIWILVLILVTVGDDQPGDRGVLIAVVVVATAWTGVTLWAARTPARLGSVWFVIADGVVAVALGFAGLWAGTDHIISASWPNSWLFVVAFGSNLRWTMAGALLLTFQHAWLHLLHDLDSVRTAGVIQFVVFGLIAGWAFDALRHREELRLDAEARLANKHREVARHEERAELARHLHDSYLQTLVSTRNAADDPDEVRYLTRRQEREVRRTIERFRSPHERSFRAELLRCRDEVEDLYKTVDIKEVIRDDAELTTSLEAVLAASREAMLNAAKHGAGTAVDLYSEIKDGQVWVHVRDRGPGFEQAGSSHHGMVLSMIEPVEAVGGVVTVESAVGEGTEVTIRAPLA